VILIGARLGDHVDGAAEAASDLGRETVAVDLEFFDCFLAQRGPHAAGVNEVLHAVDREHVAAPVAAAEAQPGLRRLGHAEVGAVHHVVGFDDAGGEQRHVQVVAAVDGQRADLLELYGAGLLGPLRLNHRRFRDDVHLGGDGAQIQGDGQIDRFTDMEFDPLHDLCVKARSFDAHTVLARLERRGKELAFRVRLHGAGNAAVRVRDRDRSFDDGQSRGVQDLALQVGRCHLGLAISHAGGEEKSAQATIHCPATSASDSKGRGSIVSLIPWKG